MFDYQKNTVKYFTNYVSEIIALEIYPPSIPDSILSNISIWSIVKHVDHPEHVTDVDCLKKQIVQSWKKSVRKKSTILSISLNPAKKKW